MPTSREIEYQLHPQRDALYNELHIRPFHNLSTPQQITHLAANAQLPELAKSFELICELCRRYEVNQPQPGAVVSGQEPGTLTPPRPGQCRMPDRAGLTSASTVLS